MAHAKHSPNIEIEDADAASRLFTSDIKNLINSESIVIDVGANKGQFAAELLAITNLKKIYSFEPVPDAYEHLRLLASNERMVEPIQAAVSTKSGTTNFYVTKSDVGSSLLKPLPNQSSKWLTVDSEIPVETLRLDEFINTRVIGGEKKIDLLKSDAQGADLDVLRSAGEFLIPEKIRSVLVEINFANFYHGQNPYYDVLALLDRSGYKPARFYPYRAHDGWLWWADALFIGK